MMKYRNKKTGAVIETGCKVSGEYWEPILPEKKQSSRKKEDQAKNE